MSVVVLVKHVLPAIAPGTPAPDWPLNDDGRRQAAILADRLHHLAPVVIAASPEPKASETARIIAARQQAPVTTMPDLREHGRRHTPFLSAADFAARVEAALRHPDELIIGEETATAARRRFTTAVETLLATTPAVQPLIVVTHGTVISLYVAHMTGLDPVPLWRRLGLPSYVVLSRPDLSLVEVVDSIE